MDKFLQWARNLPAVSEQIEKGPLIVFHSVAIVIVILVMISAAQIPTINELVGINLSAAILSTLLIVGPIILALSVIALRSRFPLGVYRTICAIFELATLLFVQAGIAVAMASSLPAGAVFFSMWWILIAYSFGYTLRTTLTHPYQTVVTLIVVILAILASPSKPHLAINIFSGFSALVLSLWGGYVGVMNDLKENRLLAHTRELEEALTQRTVDQKFITEDSEIPFRTDSVTIREGNCYRRIPFESIVFLSAHGMKTTVHTDNGAFVASNMLGAIYTTLPPDIFIRIHKSYAVRASRISRIQYFPDGRYMVFLDDDENTSLPVGRRFAPIVRTYMRLPTV